MASRREEDTAKRKGKVVFYEASESIKKLSSVERAKLEKMVRHMGKLDKSYPVESGNPMSYKVYMYEFRKLDAIRLKSVKSNIPQMIDIVAMRFDIGLFDIINGKHTSEEIINGLTTFFERVQNWLESCEYDNMLGVLSLPNFDGMIDALISWRESPPPFNSRKAIEEIHYCHCPMSMREHVEMMFKSLTDILKKLPELESEDELSKIIDDTMKRYEHRSGRA
jgi:hypothetical protein